jgi:hypothetical protein
MVAGGTSVLRRGGLSVIVGEGDRSNIMAVNTADFVGSNMNNNIE